mmetsp:Transcript_3566/g.5231  ORF Transcript_3566/g.5231 Transcript_3566/m.5231 type:complete len:248 (+) Transcript_3566:42-785(+)
MAVAVVVTATIPMNKVDEEIVGSETVVIHELHVILETPAVVGEEVQNVIIMVMVIVGIPQDVDVIPTEIETLNTGTAWLVETETETETETEITEVMVPVMAETGHAIGTTMNDVTETIDLTEEVTVIAIAVVMNVLAIGILVLLILATLVNVLHRPWDNKWYSSSKKPHCRLLRRHRLLFSNNLLHRNSIQGSLGAIIITSSSNHRLNSHSHLSSRFSTHLLLNHLNHLNNLVFHLHDRHSIRHSKA